MNIQESGGYKGITAELYDLWFQDQPIAKDLTFYEKHIQNNGGFALEIGSGSGRLLLPYAQKGMSVCGIEPSEQMIAICNEKAHEFNINPVVYQQYMQELNIPFLFKTIYIPLCTFQLLISETDVMGALQRFYLHLEPGGQLLISLFVPDATPANQGLWRVVRTVERQSDGALIILSESLYSDRFEQVHTKLIRYEICQRERCTETYIKSTQSRWYNQKTLRFMLEKIGFKDITNFGDYSDTPANNSNESLVVSAYK